MTHALGRFAPIVFVVCLAWIATANTPARAQDQIQPPTQVRTLGAVHHDARVKADPVSGSVSLENTITVEAEGRVRLRLNAAFVIERLKLDGMTRSPMRQGDLLVVDVGSQGVHTIAINARANLATKAQHEQPPFLTVEGGFFGLGWLGNPVGTAATYRIAVETPLPHIAVLPGRLEEEHRDGELYRAVFASQVPGEAPVLITGPFTVSEKAVGQVRLRTYFHDELAPLAQGYLDDAARYVAHYADSVGPYPYPGFAMVSGPLPVGIGLPGMTYMGRRVLALPFIRATSLPHEVLHNWWGNAVGVDYEAGNWAEGLTTYQADHALAASQNQDGGQAKRLEWLRNFAALPPEADHPPIDFVTKAHDATQVVGYGKVAFIFHMLKVRLGDEAFARAIKRFYADNRNQRAGWADIQAAFEAETQEDLSAFFTPWLNQTGAPALVVQDASFGDGAVSFTLKQTQDRDAFPLSVPVEIRTPEGALHVTAQMDEKTKAFRVRVEGTPTALAVDPGFDVFRRLSADEVPPIFRDVTLRDDTLLIAPSTDATVMAAALTLGTALLEREPDVRPATAAPTGGVPLIVAGLEDDVRAYLERHALPLAPQDAAGPGDGRAFIARDAQGRTVMVVMARDLEALNGLARVLAHYKRRSFVIMDGGHVTAKGTFAPTKSPLIVPLDPVR